ncbi:hypothetical protein NO559_02340 [Dasania sp. GY-MA-18]|uniref:Lipopolysaccharide kinase n=1 Tax=Dasania phycosphaerae TaxID=2950436 RepID=A0A9J6RHV0_9GAMM|nr:MULTISPECIES: hypothetical protein [Dasania]MCR8921592.1 hypothetical protein [Dasania sp. GY-MA-18]MCZ0864020.1 hypothetical protein [Dasania phycosphaerae]MCZ0867748.1 hypothetical protein [Dasania phycosphaerae]
MIRLRIHSEYADLLKQHRLNNYHDFANPQLGELIAEERKRYVRKLTLGDKTFFLKRSKIEKTSSAIEQLLSGRTPHSRPYRETLHIEHIKAANIKAMNVAAVGELVVRGIPKEGFILSEQAPGQDTELFYLAANKQQRLALYQALGGLLAKLHNHGFFANLRLRDVFCTLDQQQFDFTLIDRETRNPRPKKVTKKRCMQGLAESIRRQSLDGSTPSALEIRALLKNYCHTLNRKININPKETLQKLRRLQP